MKRICVIVLFLMLTACSKEEVLTTLPDPVPDQQMNSSDNDVSLILEKVVFNESPTIIKTIVKNSSNHDYRYGEFYHVEVNKKGFWYIITYSDSVFLGNPGFIDTGSLLLAGEEVHQQFSIENLDVTLPPGEYRLVKSLLSSTGAFNELSMAVPFTVK